MKQFLQEFKTFAMRGNVVDLAVGVVIGGAFGKITTSLVNDLMMPVIGMLTGGLNFSDWKVVLKEAVLDASGAVQHPEVAVHFGNTLAIVLDFVIIAFAVFCLVKLLNGLRRKEEAPAEQPAPPEPSAEEKLLCEIRDLLRGGAAIDGPSEAQKEEEHV